jgi:hypothetical protein
VYFIYFYENRTMKPTEIILRREKRVWKSNGEGEPRYIVSIDGNVTMTPPHAKM